MRSRTFQRDVKIRKNLSLEIPAGPKIWPIRSSAISALIARPHSARASFTPDREDEKREAYRGERNRRFIQNSPMTVSSVFARSYPVVTNVRSYVWSR